MSYWEGLDKKVQEYADKNGFMYVIDEEPFCGLGWLSGDFG